MSQCSQTVTGSRFHMLIEANAKAWPAYVPEAFPPAFSMRRIGHVGVRAIDDSDLMAWGVCSCQSFLVSGCWCAHEFAPFASTTSRRVNLGVTCMRRRSRCSSRRSRRSLDGTPVLCASSRTNWYGDHREPQLVWTWRFTVTTPLLSDLVPASTKKRYTLVGAG